MTSLTQLNESAASPIEVTDARPATVIFDRFSPRDFRFTISNLNKVLTPQVGINEIVNYSTANVRYRITIRTNRSAFISGSSITFNGMPSGASVATTTTTFAKAYTVSGLTSAKGFDQIKTVTWNLPVDFALTNKFWVESEVVYYDQATDKEVINNWASYDPFYYFLAALETSSSFAAVGGYTKKATAAFIGQFDFETNAPYTNFRMASTARAYVTANGRKARLLRANLSTPAATFTAQGKFFRAGDQPHPLTSISTVVCRAGEIVRLINRADFFVVAGRIGPAGVPYLEGNGLPYYNYDGTLLNIGGLPPGITRIKQGAAALVVTGGEMVVGDKLKRATASLSCNITVPNTEVKQFKGVLNRNLPTVSTFTANFRVDYDSDLGELAATSAVYARPVQKQIAEADLIASSSLSASANVLQTATDMVLIFNVQNTGTFPRKIYLPFEGTVNVTVDWGDGEVSSYNSRGLKDHTYTTTGTKTVIVTRNSQSGTALGTFGMFNFGNVEGSGDQFTGPLPNRGWLTEITSFGNLGITRLANIDSGVFTGLSNVPSFLPPSVTSLYTCRLSNSFSGAASWNPVNVQNFSQLFFGTDWNRDISHWDVSSATNMNGMFQQNTVFNQNISSWNVSNVTNMQSMFSGATAFNQNISSWNTGNVTTMYGMFSGGSTFNQPLNSWNVSNVTTMLGMFQANAVFNQPLNSWNVSKVTNMQFMFYETASFDQDISGWSVRPRITTKPTGFDTGTPSSWITAEKPNWGV